MGGSYLLERPFPLALLEITQLILAFFEITQLIRCELPRRGRMVNVELLCGVMPIIPVEPLTNRSCQQFAIQNPDSINGLSELPACKSILAAQHLKITTYIIGCETLDLLPVLRVNELLDALHIPSSLLFGYGCFIKANQVVTEKA